jgi:hypothetical protein
LLSPILDADLAVSLPSPSFLRGDALAKRKTGRVIDRFQSLRLNHRQIDDKRKAILAPI